MKYKINIFSKNHTNNLFLKMFSNYEIIFKKIEEFNNNFQNTSINIIISSDLNDLKLINLKNLHENTLLISSVEEADSQFKNKTNFLKVPKTVNYIKNIIENFVENFKFQFYDISICNEKLTNTQNNSFCYLTKVETEILRYLITEKEISKNYIKKNILNINSNIETNSLDSHLTRIRKKLNEVNTCLKIQSKSENLLITI